MTGTDARPGTTVRARRIDHAVVVVHDLDAAAELYGRLGFTVGARNRHPWGTENRLIQFGSSFIELITVGDDPDAIADHAEGRFSFGAFVRDASRRGEGMAMLVLSSDDGAADAALYKTQGFGAFEPFFFERRGQRPDGRATHVAFTLAFAVDPHSPEAGFFVCQQHFPENFWTPALQRHASFASDIAAVGMTASCPSDHAAFLAGFTGAPAGLGADGSLAIELPGGRLEVEAGRRHGLAFRSLTLRTPDLAAQAERLGTAGIPFTLAPSGLSVPAEAARGVEIRFADIART